jgi:hypothetical protein
MMMIHDELDGGSRRQDDSYGRAVVGTGKSGVLADTLADNSRPRHLSPLYLGTYYLGTT